MDPDQPDPFEPLPEEARPAKPAPIAPHASERLSLPATRLHLPWTVTLGFVVGLVGVAALGAAAWVYVETQRDIVRLSTELAQIRLSLELFNQQAGAAPVETETGTDPDLTDLANRLAILEQNWRQAPAATPAPAATSAAPTGDGAAGDCLPVGTRFLVTTGDRYPVCGQSVAVEVGAVDDGFITLADSTVIAAGGTFPLAGTSCMLGVVNAGPELGGYAEIRVTC